MKRLLMGVLLLSVGLVFADDGLNLNSEELQTMMAKMEQVQLCMEQLDQASLKQIEGRTQQLLVEVKQLCTNGKPAQAKARAISFGKQLANDKQVIEMKRCAEIMTGMVPNSLLLALEDQLMNQHICD